MTLIELRSPYSFERSIGYWRRSTAELTEQWSDGVYRRLIEREGGLALLSLCQAGTLEAPAVLLELTEPGQPFIADGSGGSGALLDLSEPGQPGQAFETGYGEIALARRLLCEDLDLAAAEQALAGDALLAPLLERYRGLKPPRPLSLWEALVWAICAQQITLVFALRLKERLVRRFGQTRLVAGRPLSTFPAPAALAEADPRELQAFQFSASKASFIIGLAQAIERGELDLHAVEALPTPEALAYLVSLRGIGPWTAEYALLRGLGRADAFPAGDAGVRAALIRLGALGPKPAEQELRSWAERRQPWAGLAAIYLWRWLSEQ